MKRFEIKMRVAIYFDKSVKQKKQHRKFSAVCGYLFCFATSHSS